LVGGSNPLARSKHFPLKKKFGASPPTRLYLIRHGEVAKTGYCNGHQDVALTDEGKKQAMRLARLLAARPISAVYASPLQRAMIGARRIALRHRLTVRIEPDLREKNFGKWEGLPLDEIQSQYRREWTEWLRRPDRARPSKGETYLEVEKRVLPVLDRIVRSHSGREVAVVCHGGVTRIALCRAMGLDLEHMNRLRQDYGAINIIEYTPGRSVICLVNGRHIP
jgi:alpha-ribazole phosphatase